MRIIVFGATGGLGQWTWKAAVKAGHDVVAFVRSPQKLDDGDPGFGRLEVVKGDATDGDAVAAGCGGCEALVNCTSPAGGNSTIELARSIVTHGSASGVKQFYMVGGLGALWAPNTGRSVLVQDWEDAEGMAAVGLSAAMPRDMIRKMTKGHLASMALLAELGVAHTFLCPGMMKDAPPTSTRVVTLDEVGGTQAGQVTMGDVAEVIVADLGTGALLGHRVSVAAA
ncbi:MAG: NAD(P)H-binding protein [Myxococcota bacterium]